MKGSMLMGTQRNKLGNMVYYRRRGEEIARAKVTPANPRTERQARQRMNFATLQLAKSLMAEIVNHSYQGVEYGDISLNHFTKINVPLLKNAAANPSENAAYFLPRGVKALAPNEYIVSDGSLAKLAQTWDSVNDSVILSGSSIKESMSGPDDYIAQLAALGFAPGDQLTVMHLVNTGAVVASTPAGDSIYDVQLVVKRIVFKTVEEVRDWSAISSMWVGSTQADHNLVNPALLVADKSDTITFFNGLGTTSFNAGVFLDASPWGASAQSVAGVIIRSSLVNGQWLRSPQTLLVLDDGESRPSVADVLSTYMDTTTDPESPYYLNQSQARSAQASGVETPYIVFGTATGGTFSGNTFVQAVGADGHLSFETNGAVTLQEVHSTSNDFSVSSGTISVSGSNIELDSATTGSMCVFDVLVDGTIVTRITAYVAAE